MSLKVAIIGRPNVGKSTLFNRLAGRRIALVHDNPGVTRDRKIVDITFRDLDLELIDTAGFEIGDEKSMETRMLLQTKQAIKDADICLFVFDAKTGLHPYDETLSSIVRQSRKKVILLANKCENKKEADSIFEAYKLGLGEPIAISAEHGLGIDDLYETLSTFYQEKSDESEKSKMEENHAVKIAFVGRPNVGKSTLVNALLGDERLLTGPEAGLTRDSIEISFQYKDQPFCLVDTAGLRKQAKITDSLERLSALSTQKAAFSAEVVVLVLDADMVLDKQDLTIARQVIDEGRALVIAVNKWDIADRKETIKKLNDKLQASLAQVSGIQSVTISALKKEGLNKLMDAVLETYKRWNTRVPTALLNQWFRDVQEQNQPPLGKNKRRIKLKYITQARIRPPSFFIFSSNPEGLPESYLRYLASSLRDTFDFKGVPIRIKVRKSDNPYA